MYSRNYSEVIMKNPFYHQQLEENGFFIADILTEEELQETREYFKIFSAMIAGEKLDYFAASCNVQNISAVNYSKNNIDKVFSKAFNRVFLSEKVQYTGGVFMMKAAGENTYHPLHQDIPVVDERLSYALYSWTPITETDETTGRMFVVPKSHNIGTHQRSPLIKSKPLDEEKYKKDYLILDVKVGQTLFFDSKLMHGSLPNTSGKTRVVVNFFIKPSNSACIYHAQNNSDDSLVDVYEINPEYFFEQEHHSDKATGKNMKFLKTENKVV